MLLLGLQMAKIVVSVVDADGDSITPTPVTFKPEPPKTCEVIVKELRAAGHGEGHLLDKDGDTVTRGELVPGGDYRYRVTGECTVQVCMRGMEKRMRVGERRRRGGVASRMVHASWHCTCMHSSLIVGAVPSAQGAP